MKLKKCNNPYSKNYKNEVYFEAHEYIYYINDIKVPSWYIIMENNGNQKLTRKRAEELIAQRKQSCKKYDRDCCHKFRIVRIDKMVSLTFIYDVI